MAIRLTPRAALAALALWSGVAQAEPYRAFAGHPLAFAQSSGKVVAFYLDSDAIAAGYRLDDTTAGDLTHLLYAFLEIRDEDFRLAVDRGLGDARMSAYFAALKQRAPGLTLLASIGGAMGSKPFFALTRSAESQGHFVDAVLRFLRTHPMFDGIDIDWEFPTDSSPSNGEPQLGEPKDGEAYARLMQALHAALDTLGPRHYQLTSAVSTAARLTRAIDYRAAAEATDLFFAMSYDYYGPWAPRIGHHTPVLPPDDPALGPVGTAPLLEAGIPPSKLVRGVAAYSRGWALSPAGTLVADYNGRDGTESYRDLAALYLGPDGKGRQGYRVEYDQALQAYALKHPVSGIYIGYDDPRAVREKGRLAARDGLAGLFGWELSQDNGDLLNAMNEGLGNRLR